MARRVEVDLVGDTRAFESSMKSATSATDKLESSLKDTGASADKFKDRMSKTEGSVDSTATSFRGLDALASGLGATLGIEGLDAVSGYAVGIADMADGMKDLLLPMLAKSKAAFLAMNATLLANPIFLVIAALAALTIGFVIAYKKSETFRNIVHKVFNSVKDGAVRFKNAIVDAVMSAARTIGKVADIITTPYQLAFKAIKAMWNATLGGFGVSIPGFSIPFGPSFGGLGFTIPEMAKGGIVNGPTLAMIGEAGPEAVVPLSGPRAQALGGSTTIIIQTGASDLDELIRKRVRIIANGNVQKAFGSA